VPADGSSLKAGKVSVAGVAWAQHKGIEAVEARVDNARGTRPRSPSYRDRHLAQWVWEWDATPGTHLIEARATTRPATTQTSVAEDVAPNGASGYPATQVSVS